MIVTTVAMAFTVIMLTLFVGLMLGILLGLNLVDTR